MAIDATGTPTPLGIPKLNTAVDAPSGKGINAMMDAIDLLIAALPGKPAGIVTGEAMVYNTGAGVFQRSSVTKLASGNFGPVVNTDVDAAAAIAVTKLAAGSNGQVLTTVSGAPAWSSGGGAYDRVTSTTDINTTVAESTLYTKTISANDLSTNKTLRLTALTDFLYNNVAGNTCRIRVKFGATTLLDWTHGGANATTSATRTVQFFDLVLTNLGATNSQILQLRITRSGGGSNMGDYTLTTGAFGVPARGDITFIGVNTAAEDTTANKDLVITVQWGTSSANNSYRLRQAILELI